MLLPTFEHHTVRIVKSTEHCTEHLSLHLFDTISLFFIANHTKKAIYSLTISTTYKTMLTNLVL